jgi:hypothetical protein
MCLMSETVLFSSVKYGAVSTLKVVERISLLLIYLYMKVILHFLSMHKDGS